MDGTKRIQSGPVITDGDSCACEAESERLDPKNATNQACHVKGGEHSSYDSDCKQHHVAVVAEIRRRRQDTVFAKETAERKHTAKCQGAD